MLLYIQRPVKQLTTAKTIKIHLSSNKKLFNIKNKITEDIIAVGDFLKL